MENKGDGECPGIPLSLFMLPACPLEAFDCQTLCLLGSLQLPVKSWRNWDIMVGEWGKQEDARKGLCFESPWSLTHGFRTLCLWLKPGGNETRIPASFSWLGYSALHCASLTLNTTPGWLVCCHQVRHEGGVKPTLTAREGTGWVFQIARCWRGP